MIGEFTKAMEYKNTLNFERIFTSELIVRLTHKFEGLKKTLRTFPDQR